MNISKADNSNAIFTSGKTVAEAAKTSAVEKDVIEKANSGNAKEERRDTLTLTNESVDITGIYSRESIIEQLKAAEEQRIQSFKDTITSMLAKQGEAVNLTFRGLGTELGLDSELNLHVTEEIRKKAEESISEGGEYSVNAVADRIMAMAQALSGGDESKISILREAVQKGFAGTASVLGLEEDNLPEITKNTYTEIMSRFDEWENSFKSDEAADETVSETVAAE